jgi:hypothetical protein
LSSITTWQPQSSTGFNKDQHLCSQSRFYRLLNPIEIEWKQVLLIELFTARQPIPVDPCGFWVL